MSHSAPSAAAETGQSMTHRQILEALSGLLLAMFVSMVSSTVVSNALPTIVGELHGSPTGYTWIIVATLLTMTATTPIWGKFADLFNNKMLVQLALLIFLGGSLLAGFASDMETLIAARAIQGVGVGGLTALVQVVIAKMVTPRERGRYSGYIGATFALATVSGPLIGGLLVDTVGWEWCFWFGVPLSLLAFVVLQKTLKMEFVKREVKIDYVGALLLMAGISVLLIWVSLAGKSTGFAWVSWTSLWLVAGSVVLTVLAIVWEGRFASEPVIPLRLFKDRTTSLATAASVMIGVAMFGAVTYLSQYFQMARAMTPTHAGLMSIFMVGGLFVSSVVSGRIITATGRWKRFLVSGMVLVVAGLSLLALIDADTNIWLVGGAMTVLGLGLGMTMQNLVLAVQNNTANADMGAASSVVAFFRSIGGSVGVAALGALLSTHVSDYSTEHGPEALARISDPSVAQQVMDMLKAHQIPLPSTLEEMGAGPVAQMMEQAYGSGIGSLFLVAIPFSLIALVLVVAIREVPLRTTILREDELDKVAAETGVAEAVDA